jgi:hypothetical protein
MKWQGWLFKALYCSEDGQYYGSLLPGFPWQPGEVIPDFDMDIAADKHMRASLEAQNMERATS